MKKTKKPRKTTRHLKRKTRHLRKSKRNFRLRTQRGGGPSDTYLHKLVNCVRLFYRLRDFFSHGFPDKFPAEYKIETLQGPEDWEVLKTEMDQKIAEMKSELDIYGVGNVFDDRYKTTKYTLEDAGKTVRYINKILLLLGRQTQSIVPKEETIALERLFGDPNMQPRINEIYDEMEVHCAKFDMLDKFINNTPQTV